jgi:hypothetical protein
LRGGSSGRGADGLICATSQESGRFLDGRARWITRFLLFFENHAVLQHGCPWMKFELVKRVREQ